MVILCRSCELFVYIFLEKKYVELFIALWFGKIRMKPKGVIIQMKALDEYILMVLFVLFLKRFHFLVNET